MVALDAGPPELSYTLDNGAALRTAPNEIAAHEHLVDVLVGDVLDDGFEGRDVAVNIGNNGNAGHGHED